MTREGLIETMARAMCVSEEVPADEVAYTWEDGSILHWETYIPAAAAALAAIEAAGVRLVPSEASRPMLVAAHMVERDDIELTEDEHRAMYAAFLSASPYAPKEKSGVK